MMSLVSDIAQILGHQVSISTWAFVLMILALVLLSTALGSAIRGWHRALDMTEKWRQRYDAALDVLMYWKTQHELLAEDGDE